MPSCRPWYGALLAVVALELLAALAIAWHRRAEAPWPVLAGGLAVAAIAVYRAATPVAYSTRKVWFDHPANAALTVRLVATVAEVCAPLVIAVALTTVAPDDAVVWWGCAAAVALIVTAQGFATAGVVTARRWKFGVEESLWMAAGVAVLLACWRARQHRVARVLGVATAVYLVLQAVAMALWHWNGELHRPASDRSALDTSLVTRDCDGWGPAHLAWSSAYFAGLTAVMLYLMVAV